MGGFQDDAGYACLVAAAVLFVVLASFRAGRRRGMTEGIRLGGAEALIAAREEALESGWCPLCAASVERAGVGREKSVEGNRPVQRGYSTDRSLADRRGTYLLTGGSPPDRGPAGGRST